MSSSVALTREKCAEIFRYLEATSPGKAFIQDQLRAIQQRHEDRMRTKLTSKKTPSLLTTKPDKNLNEFKPEIFYHYMQPKSSSKRIRDAMKEMPEFDLSKRR
jgi:hypothetical protein